MHDDLVAQRADHCLRPLWIRQDARHGFAVYEDVRGLVPFVEFSELVSS